MIQETNYAGHSSFRALGVEIFELSLDAVNSSAYDTVQHDRDIDLKLKTAT